MNGEPSCVSDRRGFFGGIDFQQSRHLLDNNNRVAGGGRLTVGGPNVRVGASIMSGRSNDRPGPGGGPDERLDYLICGCDVQARYKDLSRLQFEYARRNSDRSGDLGAGPVTFTEKIGGSYVEGEVRFWEKAKVSLLARYDILCRDNPLPPFGSPLPTGTYDVQRFTWGVNFELWRQSLLMINHERWFLPGTLPDAHVFGVRYAISF